MIGRLALLWLLWSPLVASTKRLTASVVVNPEAAIRGLQRVGRETDTLGARMRGLETAATAAGLALLAAGTSEYLDISTEQVRAELQTGQPAGALDYAFGQVSEAARLTGLGAETIAPLATLGISRGLTGEDLETFIGGGAIQGLIYDIDPATVAGPTLQLAQTFGLEGPAGGYLAAADIIGGIVQANPRLAQDLLPYVARPAAAGREAGFGLGDILAAGVVGVQEAENPAVAFTQLNSLLRELNRQAADPRSTLASDYGLTTERLSELAEGGLGAVVDYLEDQPGTFNPLTAFGRVEAGTAYIGLRDNPADLAAAERAAETSFNILYEGAGRFRTDPGTIGRQLQQQALNIPADIIGDISTVIAERDPLQLWRVAAPTEEFEQSLERLFTGGRGLDEAQFEGIPGLVRTPEAATRGFFGTLQANLADAISGALSIALGGGGGATPGLEIASPRVVVNQVNVATGSADGARQRIADELADTATEATGNRRPGP